MKNVDLLASYWTIAGAVHPHSEQEFSSWAFEDRINAASKAGFTGVGLKEVDVAHTLERLSLKDMRHILDDNGIRHVELEFISDWFCDGEKKKQSDKIKHLLLEAAEALGARHIKVGDFDTTLTPMPKLIESFAALCKDAENYGTRILFELIVDAMIKTLPETLEMLSGADAKNGGVMLDLWHIVKLRIPYEEVAKIPLRFMLGVELNDGTLECPWSLHEDTINHRRLCGEGEFVIKDFVKQILAAGYDGPWGIEVLSEELRKKTLDEAATQAFNTTIAQFPED
ncbi:MAG: sugar phosphate isomerase/epimerase [Acidobacteriota bacterium]|jgi:sugar phosphate isomerase/epimerase|nr:sugar phosphate isomerase/epimerase [Acidobacteriota bacterium]